MSAVAARDSSDFFASFAVFTRQLRRGAYLLSGVLLATVSARAEAPVLSPEFWNYMVEFGDGKGEVFDPADYATVTNLPAKARAELDRAAAQQPASAQDRGAAQPYRTEQSHRTEPQGAADNRAASQGEEQSR